MKTLILSDLHLGARHNNADQALLALKENHFDKLILNGDIVDGWRIQKYGFKYWTPTETSIIKKIIKLAKTIEVIYIVGNHDDFLSSYIGEEIMGVEIVKKYIDNDTLFIHGDIFDAATVTGLLSKFGAWFYDYLIVMNNVVKKLFPRFSLSKYLKSKTKRVVNFISNYKYSAIQEAKKHGCTTICCGHIHSPADEMIDGIRYLNSGDFQEGNSYITIDKKVKIHGLL